MESIRLQAEPPKYPPLPVLVLKVDRVSGLPRVPGMPHLDADGTGCCKLTLPDMIQALSLGTYRPATETTLSEYTRRGPCRLGEEIDGHLTFTTSDGT